MSPHSSAITSAEMPCGTIGQRSPIFSFTAPQPASPRFEPIGTRVMCSTPAATTRSRWPACTAEAALNAVCSDEPHCRSTVVAHTVSGQPATRTAPRPTFSACSPTCVTQPICTSSISPGSRSTRPTRPFSTCAASSSARISESEPFRRPIGERTASTTYAAGMSQSIERAPGRALGRIYTHAVATTATERRAPHRRRVDRDGRLARGPLAVRRLARRARREGRRRGGAPRGRGRGARDDDAAAGARARSDPRPHGATSSTSAPKRSRARSRPRRASR